MRPQTQRIVPIARAKARKRGPPRAVRYFGTHHCGAFELRFMNWSFVQAARGLLLLKKGTLLLLIVEVYREEKE